MTPQPPSLIERLLTRQCTNTHQKWSEPDADEQPVLGREERNDVRAAAPASTAQPPAGLPEMSTAATVVLSAVDIEPPVSVALSPGAAFTYPGTAGAEPGPTSTEIHAASGADTAGPTTSGPSRKKPRSRSGSSSPATRTTADKVAECRLARAYLMRVAEPPATALLAFVDSVGPVEAAAAVRAAAVPERVLAEISARRHLELAESDLADARRIGARLVVPEDEEWPAWPLLSLAAASDRGQRWSGSPLGLWAKGPVRLADTVERAVAVVGARSASGYGEYVAAEIGHDLANAGMTVVSGAAFGIDGQAHRGALAAKGTTVAVLACGVDLRYPVGHSDLIDEIAATGLILSEYPPGTPPARHRFLVRNRLIAALSSGTVVVEAGVRSGARNTATTAAALGKVVLAVPGPITSATSAGCHDLLRAGTAMLAGSVPEILEAVGPVGEHLVEPPSGPVRRTDGLGGQALRVYEALSRRTARTPARVAVESGVPIDRVRALLPELELTDLARRCDEGWRRAPDT